MWAGRGAGASRVPAGERSHQSAGRQVGGSPSMCAWPILISFHMTGSTTGRLRLWLTDCRCSMELNLPLMLPSCPLFEQSARRQCADLDGAALHQARQRKATTCPELAHPRGGRARLVVLGCEAGVRWSEETQLCEPVGKGEVAQGTPSTQTAGETRLVPPLEHFTGLQRGSVFRPVPLGTSRWVRGGWGHTVCHGCVRRVRTMFWDCSIIFATASKMLEILRSPHLIKRATCAEMRQHGRRRVSCEDRYHRDDNLLVSQGGVRDLHSDLREWEQHHRR